MSNQLQVIIIDDLPCDREELKEILERYHSDIEIVGQFDNIDAGWKRIEKGGIHAVFLDINFRYITEGKEGYKDKGIALAHAIKNLEHRPYIVFMSASDEFAIEAHRVDPVYYIEKPFDKYIVKEAVDNVHIRINGNYNIHKPHQPPPPPSEPPESPIPSELQQILKEPEAMTKDEYNSIWKHLLYRAKQHLLDDFNSGLERLTYTQTKIFLILANFGLTTRAIASRLHPEITEKHKLTPKIRVIDDHRLEIYKKLVLSRVETPPPRDPSPLGQNDECNKSEQLRRILEKLLKEDAK
ncbi:MAG: response regulator [Candidatus Methylumidiphilus sp.]